MAKSMYPGMLSSIPYKQLASTPRSLFMWHNDLSPVAKIPLILHMNAPHDNVHTSCNFPSSSVVAAHVDKPIPAPSSRMRLDFLLGP